MRARSLARRRADMDELQSTLFLCRAKILAEKQGLHPDLDTQAYAEVVMGYFKKMRTAPPRLEIVRQAS